MTRTLAVGLALFACVIGFPIHAYAMGKPLPIDEIGEPPVLATCSPPRFTGQAQFLTTPRGTAKYVFDGICTSPERPSAQMQYQLEASWSPSETDPNKPNASESIMLTGFEPFFSNRAPGGRIDMYWMGRCKQDPWLQPEGAACRIVGLSIPEDLRVFVPDLQTLNFPKAENMISPADRQRLYAQYLRLNSPVAGTKRIRGILGPTDDMFIITNPERNSLVQQGQLFIKADLPKIGATQLTELEFRWFNPSNTPSYVNYATVETSLLLQGYQVPQPITRGHEGRWEVRARASGKAVPGPWSFPVMFRLFVTNPVPHTSVIPPPSFPVQQTAPAPSSSVMQVPAPSTSAPAPMRQSPFVVRPRGVDGTDGTTSTETVGTSPQPEKKP